MTKKSRHIFPKINFNVKHKIIFNPNDATANTTPTTEPLTPSQLVSIYGINKIQVPGNQLGKGMTVAVIIAYTYKNLNVDLKTYCSKYNIPYTPATIYTMPGATSNSGWAVEECLDVQMIKTIAPYANIVVIEARSSSTSDLLAAIQKANNLSVKSPSNPNPVNVISMSFGESEFSNEASYESYFQAPNVCYVASSGDTAAIVEFPSCLPTVLCISGTTVSFNNSQTVMTTWNEAGCGISQYITKPAYQSTVNISSTKRTCGDISFVANPNSGVYICYGGQFYVVGGTSVSAPVSAGFLAICNQLRVINNNTLLSTVASVNSLQTMLYKTIYPTPNYALCFTDITVGSDGNYNALVGYDLPTGLGSPICNVLANSLSQL